jgi:hypothetical protein
VHQPGSAQSDAIRIAVRRERAHHLIPVEEPILAKSTY